MSGYFGGIGCCDSLTIRICFGPRPCTSGVLISGGLFSQSSLSSGRLGFVSMNALIVAESVHI